MNNTKESELKNNHKPGRNSIVLLGFGSNLGDRKANITYSLNSIINNSVIHPLKVSSFYESEPVGITNQPWFINSAVLAETQMNPIGLLLALKEAELSAGRVQRDRWHEREIDIDILLFDNISIKTTQLTIPHPEFHKRRFALIPASEIAPDIVHPEFNLSISQLLAQCDDSSVVKKY